MALRRAIWPRPTDVNIFQVFTTKVGYAFVPRPPLRFFGRFSPIWVFPTAPLPPIDQETLAALGVENILEALSSTGAEGSMAVKSEIGVLSTDYEAQGLTVNTL